MRIPWGSTHFDVTHNKEDEETMSHANAFAEGSKRGVSGVPWFFINGQVIIGAQPYEVFQDTIESFHPVPAISSERI